MSKTYSNLDTESGRNEVVRDLFAHIRNKNLNECITILNEIGDINFKLPNGKTLLHYAAINDDITVINYLTSNGADVNHKDKAGNTPLHDAAKNGNIDGVKLLLANGANPNAENYKNDTPLDYADDESNFECAELIESAAQLKNRAHGMIIAFVKAMGYKSDDGGVCYGIAAMGMQAAMLGPDDVERYNNRIEKILNLCAGNTSFVTDNGKIKIQFNEHVAELFKEIQSPDISKEERASIAGQLGLSLQDFYDIQGFLQGVDLYFQSHKYANENKENPLFSSEQTPTSQNIDDVAPLVWPRNKDERSLETVDTLVTVLEKESLIDMLENLKNSLSDNDITTPIGMMVSNEGHATTVTIDPATRTWYFLDANQPASINDQIGLIHTFNEDQIDILAEKILGSFSNSNTVEPISFRIINEVDLNDREPHNKVSTVIREFRENDKNAELSLQTILHSEDDELAQDTLKMVIIENDYTTLERLITDEIFKSKYLNDADTSGLLPIQFAIAHGNIHTINMMLLEGSYISPEYIELTDDNEIQGLILDEIILRDELGNRPFNVNSTDKNGQTPLHLAILNNDIIFANALVRSGCNINAIDMNGNSPLHLAARSGNIDIVQLLMQHSANLTLENNNHETALSIALNQNNKEMSGILLEHDPELVEKPDYNYVNADGKTHLVVAIQENDLDMIEMLLESGADPNLANADGDTALHLASFEGNLEAVRILLHYKADPTIANENGETALHFAAVSDDDVALNITTALVEAGADINAMSKKYETPASIAINQKNIPLSTFYFKNDAKMTDNELDAFNALIDIQDNSHDKLNALRGNDNLMMQLTSHSDFMKDAKCPGYAILINNLQSGDLHLLERNAQIILNRRNEFLRGAQTRDEPEAAKQVRLLAELIVNNHNGLIKSQERLLSQIEAISSSIDSIRNNNTAQKDNKINLEPELNVTTFRAR